MARDAYKEERAVILRDFGVKVARLRAGRGSQEAFAHMDRVCLHRNEIGMIERGQNEPGLLVLLVLADTFEDGSFWEVLKSLPIPRERRPARHPKGPNGREAAQR